MKTFEITFTENPGVYSVNLCIAETAEQAKNYFLSFGECEIISINETDAQPKPGQPVFVATAK